MNDHLHPIFRDILNAAALTPAQRMRDELQQLANEIKKPDPQQIPRPIGARPLAVPTLDEYTDALASMDWFYAYSDDPTVYRAGSDAWHRLVAMKRLVDADGEIWNQYAPEGFSS